MVVDASSSLVGLLEQLDKEEKETQRWVASPGNPYRYRVVHERVAIRAWKSTSAPSIGQRRRGEVVSVVEVNGFWARLHPDECAGATVAVPRSQLPLVREAAAREAGSLGGGTGDSVEGQRGWMLMDGAEVGLGVLLEPVPGVAGPGAEDPAFVQPQSAHEFEMLRGLSLGMIELRELDEESRGNRAVVLAAVERDGTSLKYAAPELQADRDLVMAALRQNPRALQFASEELRYDPVLVREAFYHSRRAN